MCGAQAQTAHKHHFRFSCDAKVDKGRIIKNGAFKEWCYFVYTKLISFSQGTLLPSFYLTAGLLGPQAWGCSQAEEYLPSCLELALAMQQLCRGKRLAGFCGSGLQKGLQKTSRRIYQICYLFRSSTVNLFHTSFFCPV